MGRILRDRRSNNPSIFYWLDDALYLNITNRCTNNCYFCLRKFKTGIAKFNLKLKDEPTAKRVIEELHDAVSRRFCKEVVFCGFGEPMTRLDLLLEVARWVHKNIKKPVRIDTNGHALVLYPERDVARELKEAGVSRLSVSLNAHNKAVYHDVCQPQFENVFENILEFIKQAGTAGLDVEITAVTIPEVKIFEIGKIAADMKVGFRVRPYLPCFW